MARKLTTNGNKPTMNFFFSRDQAWTGFGAGVDDGTEGATAMQLHQAEVSTGMELPGTVRSEEQEDHLLRYCVGPDGPKAQQYPEGVW
jgi:hypothetical protein